MSKSQEILSAHRLDPKLSPTELAQKLGVKRTLVYSVLYAAKKKAAKGSAKPARVGRPRKAVEVAAKAFNDPAPTPILQTMANEVADLKAEIKYLKTIIHYLEGKVHGASV